MDLHYIKCACGERFEYEHEFENNRINFCPLFAPKQSKIVLQITLTGLVDYFITGQITRAELIQRIEQREAEAVEDFAEKVKKFPENHTLSRALPDYVDNILAGRK